MIVKLLTEHHLEFLSLKGGCTGSSGSTLVKMSNLVSWLTFERPDLYNLVLAVCVCVCVADWQWV